MNAARTPHRHNSRLAAVLVGVLLIVGLLEVPFLMAPWFAQRNQRKTFTNHRDQIAAMLQSRGIAVTTDRVATEQGWPDRINHQTYGANLIVHMPDGTRTLGRIECRDAKKRCWFELSHIGVRRSELDDLVKPGTQQKTLLTWQETVRERLSTLSATMRAQVPNP
jgi:hypothetical protein